MLSGLLLRRVSSSITFVIRGGSKEGIETKDEHVTDQNIEQTCEIDGKILSAACSTTFATISLSGDAE